MLNNYYYENLMLCRPIIDFYSIHLFSNQLFNSIDLINIDGYQINSNTMGQKKNSSENGFKKEIIEWFLNLDIQQKQEYTIIEQDELIYFILYFMDKNKEGDYKFSNNFTQISKKYSFEKKYKFMISQSTISKSKKSAENYLIDHLRIGYSKNFKLFINYTCLQQPLLFLQYLELISENQIFEYNFKQNKKNEVGENPLWFSKYSFNTLGEWITSALEKSLINKYLSIKKGNEKLTSPFEYGRTLMDFYQNMDATQKKKMLKTYPTECLLKHEIKMQCLFEIKINEIKMDDLDLIQNSIKKLEDIYYFTKQAEEQAKVKKNKSKKSPNKKIKEQLLQFQYETTTNQISQSDSNHSNLQNKELLIEQTRNSFEENQKKCQTQCLKESIDQNNKISEKILISQEKQNESIIMKQQQNLNNYREIQQQNNKINNESQQLKTVLQDCIIQQQEQSVNTYNLNKNNKRKKKKKKNNTELFIDQVFQNYLNNKINDFADQISINSNKLLNSRIVVFQRIRYFMKKLYQDYFNIDAKLFGSNALGLALPSSDIDILLTGFQVATRVDTIYLLEKISFYLKKMRWIVNCETYTTARIPIIKLQINPNIKFFQMHDFMEGGNIFRAMNPNLEINEKVDFFIKVDITIQAILQEYSHRGCQSTQFMRNHMSQRCQINQLVLILKQILYSRGLHETYRGGISSYCIFLMIASYLKQNKNCKQQQQQNEKQLGTLIYDILKFYSLQFDNKNYGISYYQNKECYFEVDDINTPLYILDPIHSNLISGNCSKYPIILQQFRKIIDSLDNMKEIIRQDLKKLQYTELKRFMQKKKSIQKWLKRYDKNQNMSIEKIMG